MGPVLTERASSPLISEKSSEVRNEAIRQIVKVAEDDWNKTGERNVKRRTTPSKWRSGIIGGNGTAICFGWGAARAALGKIGSLG
jgi:hypothetical protein